jgi:hypothetical protein
METLLRGVVQLPYPLDKEELGGEAFTSPSSRPLADTGAWITEDQKITRPEGILFVFFVLLSF